MFVFAGGEMNERNDAVVFLLGMIDLLDMYLFGLSLVGRQHFFLRARKKRVAESASPPAARPSAPTTTSRDQTILESKEVGCFHSLAAEKGGCLCLTASLSAKQHGRPLGSAICGVTSGSFCDRTVQYPNKKLKSAVRNSGRATTRARHTERVAHRFFFARRDARPLASTRHGGFSWSYSPLRRVEASKMHLLTAAARPPLLILGVLLLLLLLDVGGADAEVGGVGMSFDPRDAPPAGAVCDAACR